MHLLCEAPGLPLFGGGEEARYSNWHLARPKRRRRRRSRNGYRIYDFLCIVRAAARRSKKPYFELDLRKFARYGHINTLRGHLEYIRQRPVYFGLVVFISGDYTPESDSPQAKYRWRILVTSLERFRAKKLPFGLTADGKARHVRLGARLADLFRDGIERLWTALTTSNPESSSPTDNFNTRNSLPAVGNERADTTGPPKQAEMAALLTGLDKLRAVGASLRSAIEQNRASGGTSRARPGRSVQSRATTCTATPGKAISFTITAGEGSDAISITATPQKEIMSIKRSNLSPEQTALVNTLRDKWKGHTHRYAGGFWSHSEAGAVTPGLQTFGNSVVDSLVKLGVLEYYEWTQSWGDRLPMKARMVQGGLE